MKNIPTLKTDRIVLREITGSDLEHIFNGLSHPEVIRYYGIRYDSLEATQEQMRWFAEDKQCWWAICSPDKQTFYGAGGLNDVDLNEKKAEIGLWLLPEFWGQGIMTEALPLITNYGFQKLQLNRIEGFVETENTNCKKAMAKLDFKKKRTLKDAEFKDGKLISLEVFVKMNTNI